MGKNVFTRSLYSSAKSSYNVGEREVTRAAEIQAKATGQLDQLVDPSSFGTIRLSLPRVGPKDGDATRKELLVGVPMPVETRVDTTGSMGGNVDIAMKVLPDAFGSWSQVLEGYDIQVATGIFGDVSDQFPLCRPQFEMEAKKIVQQLTLMVPEKQGGDTPEDPDLGIFGGAYLCRHYINRIGLKGYDFTVTDAPGRGIIAEDQIIRVFGEEALEKVAENGHQVKVRGSIQLVDVWSSLLDRAHAFVLQVDNSSGTKSFWVDQVGNERVVVLPNTKYLPYVQAVIIGLTEGTLALNDVSDFLGEFNMDKRGIDRVAESVVNIPIGAQSQLPNYGRCPVQGDIFAGKPDVWEDTNIWPESSADDGEKAVVTTETEEDDWL